ncbi:hypothetical protein DFH06DRAFT_1323655 [Mycena polygramma]|nr:hypothetical protein DFH06DRAFT_1323655 [Mycena polygramma]
MSASTATLSVAISWVPDVVLPWYRDGGASYAHLFHAFVKYSLSRPIMISFHVSWDFASSPAVMSSVLGCAAALLPAVGRWEALNIRVERFQLLRSLFNLLSPAHAPLLRYLSVYAATVNDNPPAPLYTTGIPLFQLNLAGLTRLKIQGVPLPWLVSLPLPHLVSLTLHDLPPLSWPSHATFTNLLRASGALRYLSLYAVGLKDIPSSAVPVGVPHLETLTIVFGVRYAQAFVTALECLAFPSLVVLRIFVNNPIGLRPLLRSSLCFSARQVRFVDTSGDDEYVTLLFSKLGGVLALDLQQSHDTKIIHIRSTMPLLTHLYLPSPDWMTLSSVLQSRLAMGAPPLRVLCYLAEELAPLFPGSFILPVHLRARIDAARLAVTASVAEFQNIPAKDFYRARAVRYLDPFAFNPRPIVL